MILHALRLRNGEEIHLVIPLTGDFVTGVANSAVLVSSQFHFRKTTTLSCGQNLVDD